MPAATPKNLALTAFVVALATIAGAWAFELLGGFVPCELCYLQRWPYYIGLPVLALTLLAWPRLPRLQRLALIVAVAAIFIWSTYLGTYHAGVEWGFWPGPTSCTGLGEAVGFDQLSNLNSQRIVPCDRPQIRIIGLSFAGWNALISAGVTVLLGWAMLGLARTAAD
jgi:disulfide bond formation protein DsbB